MNRNTILVILAALSLFACSSGPQPTEIVMVGDTELNKLEDGQSTGVNVKIYQLKDREKFRKASFSELWRDWKEYLGDTLIGEPAQEHVAVNNETAYKIDPRAGVVFVGFVAAFENQEGRGWLACMKYEEIDDEKLHFKGFRIVTATDDQQ